MKHHKKNRKLGRGRGQRQALLRSLTRSLLLKERIVTTQARAKEVRPLVEKLLTRAKTPTLANRRRIIAAISDEEAARKLVAKAQEYRERPGGYVRIVKIGKRTGDAAPMAVVEFV